MIILRRLRHNAWAFSFIFYEVITMVLVGAGIGFLCGIIITLLCISLGDAAKNADVHIDEGGE